MVLGHAVDHGWWDQPGEPNVADLAHEVVVEQDVGRLEVPVNKIESCQDDLLLKG